MATKRAPGSSPIGAARTIGFAQEQAPAGAGLARLRWADQGRQRLGDRAFRSRER
jgi:hypothetical protein